MRIISGQWRGRKIAEPQGRDVTRPTTDRVREAMASMVDSSLPQGIEGARVLAAFAGSGALGICAPRSSYRVFCADCLASAARGRIEGAPFDLVMVDAPYALGADPATQLAESLVKSGLLTSGALVLVEHAAADEGPRPDGFIVEREKRYGSTAVDLLRFDGSLTIEDIDR